MYRFITARPVRHVLECAWIAALTVAGAAWVFHRGFLAGTDDVYTILWSGRMLSEHGWFMSYNYEFQEISSSPLASLVVLAGCLLASDTLYLFNKCAAWIASASALFACLCGRRALFARSGLFAASVAVLLTLISPTFWYWSMGGMEGPYHLLLLTIYAVSMSYGPLGERPRAIAGLSVVSALLAIVRPEGVWIAAFHAFFVALGSERSTWKAYVPALAAVATLAVLSGVRWFAFGYLLPSSAHAKISLVGQPYETIERGLTYLQGYYAYSHLGWIHALVAIYAAWRCVRLAVPRARDDLRTRTTGLDVVAALLTATLAMVVLMGGDWMPFHRFLVPAVLLHNVLLAQLASEIGGRPMLLFLGLSVPFLAAEQLELPDRNAVQANAPLSIDTRFPGDIFSLLEHSAGTLQELAVSRNRAFLRERYIEEFIRDHVPGLLIEQGELRILTYQNGLFPYKVREIHPRHDDRIRFIDSFGTTQLEIARLNLPKYPFGIIGGQDLPAILGNERAELSEAVLSKQPNVLYHFSNVLTKTKLTAYQGLGYELVWRKGESSIFVRR